VLHNKDEAIHTFYGQKYASLAPAFYHAHMLFKGENKAPFFSHTYMENLEKDEWAFASNLTFTRIDNKGYMLIPWLSQNNCTNIRLDIDREFPQQSSCYAFGVTDIFLGSYRITR